MTKFRKTKAKFNSTGSRDAAARFVLHDSVVQSREKRPIAATHWAFGIKERYAFYMLSSSSSGSTTFVTVFSAQNTATTDGSNFFPAADFKDMIAS